MGFREERKYLRKPAPILNLMVLAPCVERCFNNCELAEAGLARFLAEWRGDFEGQMDRSRMDAAN